ncbi:MAG: inositol monophosphatase family protein [Spirochaetota bacterium]
MPTLQALRDKIAVFLPEVGAYQLSFFRNPDSLRGYLKSPKELVSHVDIASEKMLAEHLGKLLPEATLFGEETTQEFGEEYTWVVDPIDGTVNFVSGLQEWSISVALLHHRSPVVGLVYKPTTGELYSAVRGQGAWLDERALPILRFTGGLQEAVIATAFPFRTPDAEEGFFRMARELLPHCREIRRFGSAALDLSYTAAGFFQGYWETDLEIYDTAAALLIMEEAGVTASNFFGSPYSPEQDRSLCAAHPLIENDLLEYTSTYYRAFKPQLIRRAEHTQKGD